MDRKTVCSILKNMAESCRQYVELASMAELLKITRSADFVEECLKDGECWEKWIRSTLEMLSLVCEEDVYLSTTSKDFLPGLHTSVASPSVM